MRLQSTSVECGPASLAMILSHYGRHTSVAELRGAMGVTRDGSTAAALVAQARKLGLEARGFRTEPEGLGQVALPAIAHWGVNHFVVVERVREDGVDIVDPAVGRRRVTTAEVDRDFTGIVLEFTPTEALERRRADELALVSFLRPYLPRQVVPILAIILSSVVLTSLGLVPAFVTGYLVDRVLPAGQVQVLVVMAIGLLAFALVYASTTLARSELLLWLHVRIDWAMMTSFLQHLLSLPYRFFQVRPGGDLLVRVSSMSYLRDVISSQMLSIFLDVALLSIYLAVIASRSTVFLAAILVIGLIQVIPMATTARRAQILTQRELQALADAQSTLLESITAAETVKATGAEQVMVDRWAPKFSEQLTSSASRRRLDNAVDAFLSTVAISSPALLMVLGIGQVFADRLSLGEMLALTTLAGAALSPVNQLGHAFKSFQTVRVHLTRLRDVLDEEPESIGQGSGKVEIDGPITLSHVSYSYGGPQLALRDVSLEIRPGEKLAIVGGSGSGKSTLARIILGLQHPSSGDVSYSGSHLRDLDLGYLRRQCGVVTQDADIFSGSILLNISLVHPDVTLEDVTSAARIAAVEADIASMPMGYETVLGEGGAGLSGGQKQRIALARAVVRRPRVLLLDEATSHLDAVTERVVHQNLASLQCTRIVIAHRLSTVHDADRIIVLDQGMIVEVGTHDSLLCRNGAYAALIRKQVQPSADEPLGMLSGAQQPTRKEETVH